MEKQGNFGLLLMLSIVAALGGFLFGFDTAVISGTISFVKIQFGMDAVAEGWFVSSALLGCIIGVSMAGFLSDQYGRKRIMMLSAALFFLSALGCSISANHTVLIIYRLVGGVGVGVASMVSPMYISEISPAKYRGRMVSLYQLAITIGILTAYFTNAWVLELSDKSVFSNTWLKLLINSEVWRGMFSIEMLPALFFLILIPFIPESPRWLTKMNKQEKALNILGRINGKTIADNEITEIKESLNIGSASLKVLFTKGFRLALFIGIAIAFLQQFSGINAIIYYGPRILNEAGFSISDALGGQVIIGIVNVLFTFGAILTIDRFGRRPVLIVGVICIIINLVIVGILFQANISSGTGLMTFILLFIASFAFSFGPIGWVIISEIYPTEIRGRAMSVATLSLWVGTWMVGQFVPWLLENIGPALTFWLFAFLVFWTIPITIKLVPETKGKSLEEIKKIWIK
jgi:SP family arabinose:H+ symporter-like MFS transporter